MTVIYTINGREHKLDQPLISTESMLRQMARERQHTARFFAQFVATGAERVVRYEWATKPQGRPADGPH